MLSVLAECARLKSSELDLEIAKQGEVAWEWKIMENNQENLGRTRDLAPWVACLDCQTQEAVIAGGMQKVSHTLDV